MYLFESSTNLLMGKVPESLALLIFGVSLIVFAFVVRKLVSRREQISKSDIELSQTGNR
jgi:ABC-type Fe3+ transport system permease subunit